MSDDVISGSTAGHGWGEGRASPRFTLTVQMDGRPESDRLARVVRHAASAASGPDQISLVPFGIGRWSEDVALGCRGTLAALPGAIGCIIGQTLVTLPLHGELARLHEQIEQAELSGGAPGPGRAASEAMAAIMEDAGSEPHLPQLPKVSDDGLARGSFRTETSLLELRSRVARLEGALAGQLTARLDSRLSQLATREEMQEVAEDVTIALAAVTAMAELIEQHQKDERQRQEEQGTWREEMLAEMRSCRQQVEALSQDNQALRSHLEPRWWQMWQRWKM